MASTAMFGLRCAAGRADSAVAEAVAPVKPMRIFMRAHQRPGRAPENRDVEAPQTSAV